VSSDAGEPLRLLTCNQRRQLERLFESQPTELAGRGFGLEKVAALDRSLEDCPRLPLARQMRLSGAGRRRQSRPRDSAGLTSYACDVA
jgi:hypothetical protein